MTTLLKILHLEESADDAATVAAELRRGAFAVETTRVTTLAEARAALERGEWGLILTDYALADGVCLELPRYVVERGLDIPMIVICDALDAELAVAAMHAGAHDYISKQNLARLNPAIERELQEMAIHGERQQMQEALRQSEERLRQITENIQEVFWMVDCDLREFIYLSPAFELVWDRSIGSLHGDVNRLVESIHPEDVEWFEARLASRGWLGIHGDYRILRADGEVRWIHTRSFPIRNERGKTYRVAGLSIDITAQKQLELEKEMLSRAVEQSADAVMITDGEGVIEYVNAAFENTTGYSREETLGRTPALLKSGFHEPQFYARIWKKLQAGVPFTDIFINRRKDGELYYEAKTITPLKDSHGTPTRFVSTAKDITERLKVKERLHRYIHEDTVTGLGNRILLDEQLERAISEARRLGWGVGVLSVAIDLSGLLGDELSRALSEQLLRLVAERLDQAAGFENLVVRLEEEQFVVLIQSLHGREEAEAVANAILAAFATPVVSKAFELYFSPSIGISLYPHDGSDIRALLDHARLAMAEAVRNGHRGYLFYQREMLDAPSGVRN